MLIAIANQKGGVAKTTSTIAIGGLLAENLSCLAIDLDPQGNLTTGLGVELTANQPTVYEVLMNQVKVLDAIVETPCKLSLLPADITLAQAEKELSNQKGRFYLLRDQIEPVRNQFDYVLIDCPPSLGLLTANALVAADTLLIPVQCQFFAIKGLEGLLQTIQTVRERFNPELKVLGVLPTMAEQHTLVTQKVLDMLKERLDGIQVFNPVPKSVKFPESNLCGEPIHLHAREWRLIQPYREVVKAITLLEATAIDE
jgi:chromosome partitioning protein